MSDYSENSILIWPRLNYSWPTLYQPVGLRPWLDSMSLSWTYSGEYEGSTIGDVGLPSDPQPYYTNISVTSSGTIPMTADSTRKVIQTGYVADPPPSTAGKIDYTQVNDGLVEGEFRSLEIQPVPGWGGRALRGLGATSNNYTEFSQGPPGYLDWTWIPIRAGNTVGSQEYGPAGDLQTDWSYNGQAELSRIYVEQTGTGIRAKIYLNLAIGQGQYPAVPLIDTTISVDVQLSDMYAPIDLTYASTFAENDDTITKNEITWDGVLTLTRATL